MRKIKSFWFKYGYKLPSTHLIRGNKPGQKSVSLAGASKFSFWARENGSLMVHWTSEISLTSLVGVICNQNNFKM